MTRQSGLVAASRDRWQKIRNESYRLLLGSGGQCSVEMAELLPVVEDTLSFCHPPTVVGLYFGFTQFLPLLVLTASFLTAWRTREIIFTLYFYCLNAIYFLIYTFQEAIQDPIPNSHCTNIWGSQFGMPASDACIVFSYLVFVFGYHLLWSQPLPFRLLVASTLFVAVTPVSLYVNQLNTLPQILVGALLGTLSAIVFLLAIRTAFVPFALAEVLEDPTGLGLLLGQRDSYLRPGSIAEESVSANLQECAEGSATISTLVPMPLSHSSGHTAAHINWRL